MELVGDLVEVVMESKTDIRLQIIGWVNPTVRQQENKKEIEKDFKSIFHNLRDAAEKDSKRFDDS